MFGKLIQKIIAKKAGKYSAMVSVTKGAEPVAYIGTFCAVLVFACKTLGIDVTEETVAQIAAGATALYGVIRAVGNWWKNKTK